MKALFALVFFALAVNGHHIIVGFGSYNTSQIVKQGGYPVQTFLVETEDGYKLEITRILGKQDEREDIERQIKAGKNIQPQKPVVLLMHGIFADSSEYLFNSENSIAYLLADKGYDVFLGNFRGVHNTDDHHSRLNGHKDRAFWDYCFDDMGIKDLPVIIDKVLGITNHHKLYYIGFNEANTALFALLSRKPEYNNKIAKVVALAPLVYMKHSRNPLMQLISDNYLSSTWVAKWLGLHQLIPSEQFMNQMHSKCMDKHGQDNLCRNLYFLINGFGHTYQGAVAMKVAQAYPRKAATRQLLHHAQLINSDIFQPHHQSGDSEEYDLSKITVPIIIVSVPRDVLVDERDVDKLHNKLPTVEEHIKVNDYSCNLDLILDANVKTVVYERIVNKLHKSQE